ncbi:hypothetical protein A4G99_00880 [Haladaptatus sp. R4]|uniref:hypothetical protein n=1 Tax=Haladaptatus sp. R4 TaxID=1679489 RepID=UPI0007B48323|nr:hypothetical protein [Haladaptatus sp. R4]KZN25120.1 hypothetical protein A4G99_00880 [Haladaptatus sp. R4]
MPVYERSSATDFRVIDRWDGGFSWLAHPTEEGMRTSHAVTADDGVWLIDPLDAPKLDALLDDLGNVVGVAVLCSHHARDAGIIAARHDVSVHVPRWMGRVGERVDAPIERFETTFGDSGFRVRRFEPLSLWQEAVAYREEDRTLIVPDLLASGPGYTVGEERIGVVLSHRLFPPRDALGELEPERILFGHGSGVFEEASAAFDDALDHARKRFPRAFVEQFGTNVRLLLAAMKD